MNDPKLGFATNHCRCAACGEYFTNVRNFDAHRAGFFPERECRHPSTLVSKNGKARFTRNAKGIWQRAGGGYRGRP